MISNTTQNYKDGQRGLRRCAATVLALGFMLSQLVFTAASATQSGVASPASAKVAQGDGASPAPAFEEVTSSASGITWFHDNAMSEQRYLPETLGPGCAFFDYDNDGWMDIYLVNYGLSDFYKPTKPTTRNALYHNNHDGTFTDVTEKAGVAAGTFGMGVAVGDFNNDGFADMIVTA